MFSFNFIMVLLLQLATFYLFFLENIYLFFFRSVGRSNLLNKFRPQITCQTSNNRTLTFSGEQYLCDEFKTKRISIFYFIFSSLRFDKENGWLMRNNINQPYTLHIQQYDTMIYMANWIVQSVLCSMLCSFSIVKIKTENC